MGTLESQVVGQANAQALLLSSAPIVGHYFGLIVSLAGAMGTRMVLTRTA
jgi:hypothetical protein